MYWLQPEWPAPANVVAFTTTRLGGVSRGYYSGLNLGNHVDDAADRVAHNRALVAANLPAPPVWLNQVHGVDVVDAAVAAQSATIASADASFTIQSNCVSAVMTADCLPVLFCTTGSANGGVVAAAHAGWRGLAAGVLEHTVAAMGVPPHSVLAWLGPALGASHFEVGADVVKAFAADADAFVPTGQGKWVADFFALARARLERLGIAVYGGGYCTYSNPQLFYSHRRATHHRCVTGRMLSGIYLAR